MPTKTKSKEEIGEESYPWYPGMSAGMQIFRQQMIDAAYESQFYEVDPNDPRPFIDTRSQPAGSGGAAGPRPLRATDV